MANAVYSLARQKLLEGSIAWLTADIKCVLVDTDDYTVNLLTDEFLDDVTLAGQVAISPNFTGKTSTLGVADADNVVFSSVAGDESEAVVIFLDTGDSATSPLLAYIDTATGLPATPNGNNINVLWDDGVNKIFAI